jgi:hypothetical protein
MTRIFAALVILLALILAAPATAQDEPALISGDELGMPELEITISDEGWEAPSEVEAGRYLVTASYDGDQDFGTAAFLRLPDDWTIDDLNDRLASGASATPDQPTNGASVTSTVASMDWLGEVTMAGGVSPIAGGAAQGIIDLEPGNWAIWSDGYSPAPIPLTVTGLMPIELPDPKNAVTITESSDGEMFAFEVAREFTPGTQIIEIRNESHQPHFLEVVQLSSLVSEEQLQAFFQQEEGATPDAELDLPAGFEAWLTSIYAATQSPGTIQWLVITINPGAYAMVCWLPDPEHNNESHAQRGMITVFEVFA